MLRRARSRNNLYLVEVFRYATFFLIPKKNLLKNQNKFASNLSKFQSSARGFCSNARMFKVCQCANYQTDSFVQIKGTIIYRTFISLHCEFQIKPTAWMNTFGISRHFVVFVAQICHGPGSVLQTKNLLNRNSR